MGQIVVLSSKKRFLYRKTSELSSDEDSSNLRQVERHEARNAAKTNLFEGPQDSYKFCVRDMELRSMQSELM